MIPISRAAGQGCVQILAQPLDQGIKFSPGFLRRTVRPLGKLYLVLMYLLIFSASNNAVRLRWAGVRFSMPTTVFAAALMLNVPRIDISSKGRQEFCWS